MSKAAKRRDCPVVRTTITSAECGEHRQSRYACPVECPFNPFGPANYEALLETENALDDLTMRRLLTEEPDAGREIGEVGRMNPGHGYHASTVWRLFFRPDEQERTFAGRWSDAGWPTLKNDQRVFLRGKMQMRVALLEVQQVLDERTLLCVDLLTPDRAPIRVVDRQCAARMPRFAVVLTWIYPLPHFWRMSGTGIQVPELGPVDPDEALLAFIRRLGGPVEAGSVRALWLAKNFCRIDAAVAATAHERRRLMFSGIDAQFGKATYDLEAGLKKCREALLSRPDVAEDDLSDEEADESFKEAWVWFEPETASGLSIAPQDGRRVKGRVLLGARKARIEAMGQARLASLREVFEARLGPLVRFTAERRDDLGRQLQLSEPTADLSLVPPELLAEPAQIELQSSRIPAPPSGVSLDEYNAWLKLDLQRRMLDEPLPALKGRTPRQAAGDSTLRSTLLRIMKNHVRQLDEDNLRSGRDDDINPILRELGLHEIDFPPPPTRPRLDVDEEDNDDDRPDDMRDSEDRAAEAGRSPAPGLIGPPLDLDQALDRLDGVMESLDTAGAGIDELDLSGSTVISDMDEVVGEMMSDDEFGYFVTFVLQAWFALVPRGVRAPALRRPVMQAALAAVEEALQQGLRGSEAGFNRVLSDCRQPALLKALAGGLMEGARKMPAKLRPSGPATIGMVLGLRVMLDELDHALRSA